MNESPCLSLTKSCSKFIGKRDITRNTRWSTLPELHDYNRETEINRALAGEPFYDGFVRNFKKDQAKKIIEDAIDRLNKGEKISAEDVERSLTDYIPQPAEMG